MSAKKSKNMAKYLSYKLAFVRINRAIEHEFPLEAIAIEESIMTDRLLSFANYKGAKLNPERTTLGVAIRKVKSLCKLSKDKKLAALLEDLAIWANNRNAMLHELVKSAQGSGPRYSAEIFFTLALRHAKDGKELSSATSKWVASEIKKNS